MRGGSYARGDRVPADPKPALRRALLGWFETHRRELPWRRDRTPYRVWLAEVMLQQTQVATVIPYFERFLQCFPSVEALARAPLPEVLAQWKGLGYYSRARNLHRAAQTIAERGMPSTAVGLRELPGFGRYTAAAVASLAFGEPVALVDGNVARVLARLWALADAPGAPGREERLWAEAEALLEPARAGEFNEALMELGALVCTPANPRCEACPWEERCEARRRGQEEQIPPPRTRPTRTRLELACAVVVVGKKLLLARRPEKGLFGGLWELPCAPLQRGTTPVGALRTMGLEALEARPFARVRRTLTHRDLSLRLFRCRPPPPEGILPGYLEQRLVGRRELASLGIATAMAQAIELALARGG
ncbi:MAG: A/G-specific adenine glycosylase [Deltaproteobacteria bacterium]|nr:A/G-specific adenine glycosylase [Deltaproteobacteria bacterium]